MHYVETMSELFAFIEVFYYSMPYVFFDFRREGGYFVDLFVRVSNIAGIGMYNSLGYVVYRHIRGYYSGVEDGFGLFFCIYFFIFFFIPSDMRLSLSRDRDKKSMIPLGRTISADDLE